jgi:hypothetical protein
VSDQGPKAAGAPSSSSRAGIRPGPSVSAAPRLRVVTLGDGYRFPCVTSQLVPSGNWGSRDARKLGCCSHVWRSQLCGRGNTPCEGFGGTTDSDRLVLDRQSPFRLGAFCAAGASKVEKAVSDIYASTTCASTASLRVLAEGRRPEIDRPDPTGSLGVIDDPGPDQAGHTPGS